MIGLDRLIELKGVIAAGQFTPAGGIVRAVGDVPQDEMEIAARLCADITHRLQQSMDEHAEASSINWRPLVGWAVWSGSYTIFVMGNTGVFVDPKYADLNQLQIDLLGSDATGARPMNY